MELVLGKLGSPQGWWGISLPSGSRQAWQTPLSSEVGVTKAGSGLEDKRTRVTPLVSCSFPINFLYLPEYKLLQSKLTSRDQLPGPWLLCKAVKTLVSPLLEPLHCNLQVRRDSGAHLSLSEFFSSPSKIPNRGWVSLCMNAELQ